MTISPPPQELTHFGSNSVVKKDAYGYLFLACVITWTASAPLALSLARSQTPSPPALLLAVVSAFGPTIAALVIASRRGQRKTLYSPWRCNPVWLLVAPLVVPAVHMLANCMEVLLGGHPSQWLYPPSTPEHIAALVLFSVGEEFGWRGFGYKRLAQVHGRVLANVPLGITWGLWHFVMWISPKGLPTPAMVGAMTLELVCGSLVFAAIFEKANRSILVAILLHMGAHLDNTTRAPETEFRLRALRMGAWIFAAIIAAWSLKRQAAKTNPSTAPTEPSA